MHDFAMSPGFVLYTECRGLVKEEYDNSGIFSGSPFKHVVGTHLKCLAEALLMNTQMFLRRNKKNKKQDPRIITSYFSLTSA